MTEYDEENPAPTAGEWMPDAPYGGDGQLSHWVAEVNPLGGKVLTANITVTAYHGVADGKPVVQIDTGADVDLRVNVNDGVVFNSSVDSGDWDLIQQAALSWLNELEEYIIPALDADEEAGSVIAEYQAGADKLRAALGRLG